MWCVLTAVLCLFSEGALLEGLEVDQYLWGILNAVQTYVLHHSHLHSCKVLSLTGSVVLFSQVGPGGGRDRPVLRAVPLSPKGPVKEDPGGRLGKRLRTTSLSQMVLPNVMDVITQLGPGQTLLPPGAHPRAHP